MKQAILLGILSCILMAGCGPAAREPDHAALILVIEAEVLSQQDRPEIPDTLNDRKRKNEASPVEAIEPVDHNAEITPLTEEEFRKLQEELKGVPEQIIRPKAPAYVPPAPEPTRLEPDLPAASDAVAFVSFVDEQLSGYSGEFEPLEPGDSKPFLIEFPPLESTPRDIAAEYLAPMQGPFVVFPFRRGDRESMKRLQSPLAAKGWRTVALDMEANPDLCAALGLTDATPICVHEGCVIETLPVKCTTWDIGRVFDRYAAPPVSADASTLPPSNAGFTGLMVFGAEWCAPCHAMRPLIDKLEAEGVAVDRIDADAKQATCRRWGVTSLPSVFFLQDGQPVWRITGQATEAMLRDGLARMRAANSPI